MSLRLDAQVEQNGTKFRVYPQPPYLKGFKNTETVWVSVPPNLIEPGPADDRMRVIDAPFKPPYRQPYLPPYQGTTNPPVQPDPVTKHFDHLKVDSRDFKAAHMYATVRRVLDIWQDYSDKEIRWHFEIDYKRMELIPLITWDNAHSGYGFLEFGYGKNASGGMDSTRPYCLNFDVLAHELGHSIIFAEVGIPTEGTNTSEYGGFHESSGDLVALVSSLHFNIVVDRLLENTSGNLFTFNELARIGELDQVRQIRNAFNYERMSTVENEPHELSKPLTGAVFDIMVEVYQKELVQQRLISQDLADRSYHGPDINEDDEIIQMEFRKAYKGKEKKFKSALLSARDYLGKLLASSWSQLAPDHLRFATVVKSLLTADRILTNGHHQDTIRDCFSWREISYPTESMAFHTWNVSACALQDKAEETEEKQKKRRKKNSRK